MKYLKLYEEITDGMPRLGCWVVCQIQSDIISHVPNLEFFNNNIGKIIEYDKNEKRFTVDFDILDQKLPIIDIVNPSKWRLSEINFFSTSKEKCEEYLMMKNDIKKYNI